MITITGLHHELGGQPLFRGLDLLAPGRAPVGLVGPNGCGKTTLLRIIAGEIRPDAGTLDVGGARTVGFLRQGYADGIAKAAAEVFPAVFGPADAEARLTALGERIAEPRDGDDEAALLAEYDSLLAEIAAAPPQGDLAAAAAELALKPIAPETPLATLSGGELTKLGLLQTWASQPDALLLDEPSNHLDLAGIAWVERYIAGFPGPVIIVSHDRALLDRCAASIVEIDPRAGTAAQFQGSYSAFADEKRTREERTWEAYERQQREERHLRQVISAIESKARSIENRTIDFAIRKKAAKISRRQVTLKARLEREARSAAHIERPEKPLTGFQGTFGPGEKGASLLVDAERVALEVGARELLRDASFTVRRGDRVALLGANGSGKTTLLRALLGEHAVSAGELRLSPSAQVGYLSQDDSGLLAGARDPVEVIRRASPMPEAEAYNVLHRFLFRHERARAPLETLSYGERRRLEFARLVLGGASLLLLDEPTNHLDIPSREAFESALLAYDGAVILVSHDRYLVGRFAGRVLAIEDGRLVEEAVAAV